MRVFTLPEFSQPEYRETLFAQLQVVDFRNAAVIDREPIPCADRIVAFRVAARFSTWLVSKLDGSPDFRYRDNIAGGGGDQWTKFSLLLKNLIKAKNIGDVLSQHDASATPVMASMASRDGQVIPAALLIGIQGWNLPLYFESEFGLFAAAVDRLIDLQSEIASGIASRIDVQLDAS